MNFSLPLSWIETQVGELCTRLHYGYTETSTVQEIGPRFLRITDIQDGVVVWDRVPFCAIEDAEKEKYLLNEGDILFARTGGTVGKSFILKQHPPEAVFASYLIRLIPSKSIDPSYIYYYFQSQSYWAQIDLAKIGLKSNVNAQVLANLEITLPPLPEQHRIVAKIEELFSELDKGIDSLKTARAQLKVYRQALLKHAFEGQLTAQWRADNPDKLEPAPALLARIQAERAERYRQQVADWEAGGRQGGKPREPKTLPPLTPEELGELPALPEGWGWVRYNDVCSVVRNGIAEKPEGSDGTPIFRISAVRPLFFDMNDFRYIDNKAGRLDDYYLERGDILFTRYNGSRHYVGVCAEYRSDEKRLFPDKLIQTRIGSQRLLPSYFEKALNCGESRRFLESKIRTTAGQSGVSGDDIKNTPVPVCSTDEQAEIINLLEAKLTEVDHLEQTISQSLQQSEALRQSILKKAFSGQLVPQDPADEPAAALLERIRAEKAAQAGSGKTVPAKRKPRADDGLTGRLDV